MNLLSWFKKTMGTPAARSAHITWATSTVGRTASRAGLFLKKQLWVWPILALVLLTTIGLAVRHMLESTMRQNLQSALQSALDMQTALVLQWTQTQCKNAEAVANELKVRESIYSFLGTSSVAAPPADAGGAADSHQQLQQHLSSMLSSHGYTGFIVSDKDKRIISASEESLIGSVEIPEYDSFLTSALEGKTTVCPPFMSVAALKDATGRTRTGVPTMFVCAPVRNPSFQIVGALGLRIRPERGFTQLFQFGRIGRSGEIYAFNQEGYVISNMRSDEQLILLGLLPDKPDSRALLQLQLRDPAGNLLEGYRPSVRRSEMAWTKMAAAAIAGNAGADLDGYRDFRGVPVVGAWTWLPQCNLGLAAEADKAEAYRTLRILQVTFWVLFILLLATSVAIFIFTIIVARLQREAQKAAIEKQQLGQYRLEKELGKGAMGVVYKGYHALLRRPTAIKMLNVDRANDALMERFEHEVQITCQLNHPNTVAIYDYGRTPENVFYYAMEYLDGIDLQTLVEKYGPQPEGRVISILRQACHSLYEAHSLGLVHRDIKPANIMINWRGGEPDVVKVLDFGLVKTLEQRSSAESPAQSSLTGTPLYMSPEAFEFPNSVDCRSDVYALGAVAYFLVCGQPVFYADTLRELAHRHIDDVPVPPSVRLGKPVSVELENAVSACLEKSRAKRPQTTRELAARLSKCPTAGSWTTEDAEAWWGRHQRGQAGTTGSGVRGPVLEQTIVSGSSGTPS